MRNGTGTTVLISTPIPNSNKWVIILWLTDTFASIIRFVFILSCLCEACFICWWHHACRWHYWPHFVCDNKHDRNNVGYSARANQREKIIIGCKCKHNRCKNQITILMWNLNSTTSLTMEDRTFLVKEDDDARIGREEGVLGRSDFSVIPFQAVTVLFKEDFSSCHCII